MENGKDRKEWFREYLIEWVKKRRKGMSFDDLSDVQRSKEMTRFYVTDVVARLTPGIVPEEFEDIDDYVVDGANDLGVDFLYRTEGSVLVIQSKYHSRQKSETEEHASHFADVLQRLHAASSKKAGNAKLREALSDVDWETDHFDLRFCTLGKVSQPIIDRLKRGPTLVTGMTDFPDRVDLTLSAETDLNLALREAISADKEPDTRVSLRFTANSEGQPWMKMESEDGRELYIGQVSGAEISEIYRPNKYKLFAMNIRDYVGDTATNKGIRQTAIKKPDDFLFFNNGISAIATRIEPDKNEPNVLVCERFSVINGAQTVRSLVKAHQDNPRSVLNVRVLLRIMQFQFNRDGEFLSDVTRFNNTQNSIKISDFRSNDPVQKDFRTRFSHISVGARTCDYRNKRRRESDPNKFSITMEDFGKSVHAFLFGPDDMFGGTKYLFDPAPKAGYQKIFGEPVSHVTDEHFSRLAGIYFLCCEVHNLWRTRRHAEAEEKNPSPALERRWLVYFAVGELLRMAYERASRNLDEDLRYLGNPNKWMHRADNSAKAAMVELFDLSCTAMEEAYDKSSRAAEFRHRNWFRSQETLADIRDSLKMVLKIKKAVELLRPAAAL